MRRLSYLLLSFVAVACFRDLGNYDYTQVNEALIGASGFEQTYDVRRGSDVLAISPDVEFTLDKDGTGSYSYEWVAVGQNFYRGQRFVIGTARDLSYAVELPAEEYILYYKIKDNASGIVYSRNVPLNVRAQNTLGWILGGETHDGKGQVDMISISSNTLYLKNTLQFGEGLSLEHPVSLVWIDNDEWTSEDRLYVGTAGGAYKFDRTNFSATPFTSLKYSFTFPEEDGGFVMTDNQKVSDKRHVVIVDSKAYEVSSEGGMMGNSFCVYDDVEEFHVADRMICNHTHVQGIRTFIFYDKDNRRFCYISGLVVKGMNRLGDAEGDQWSWDTTRDFSEGLEMITAVNSFFSNGQALAIMADPSTGDKWIYAVTAPHSGTPVKNGRYKVDKSVATGFDSATSCLMTVNHGYMIYASGSAIYGYNFRKEPQECVLLYEFDAPVTCMTSDYYTEDKTRDMFMVATYDDSLERSGTVYKFAVEDDPDRMAVRQVQEWDQGFLKIRTMCYKAF